MIENMTQFRFAEPLAKYGILGLPCSFPPGNRTGDGRPGTEIWDLPGKHRLRHDVL